MNRKNHMIDLLFPLALLFVFAVSAISVLLFATNIYRDEVEDSVRINSARTTIAYVSEKVHQSEGKVTVGSLDDNDAIIIDRKINDVDWRTYIYACDGELRELFAAADVEASADLGSRITDVNTFSISRISSDLIKITCTDQDDRQAQTYLAVKEQ